jgi:hypothetical protein
MIRLGRMPQAHNGLDAGSSLGDSSPRKWLSSGHDLIAGAARKTHQRL